MRDEPDSGFARCSRKFVRALHTEHHSPMGTVHVAIRYKSGARDFSGLDGSGDDTKNTFQTRNKYTTPIVFRAIKLNHPVRQFVDFVPQFPIVDILPSRDFHSATNVVEVTKGLEKERDGGYQIVFVGAIV